MSVRVDIAIVGGQKCGTTTLYRALARHPQIFAPSAKESRAFTLRDAERDAALSALYTNQSAPYALHAYAHAWSMENAVASMSRHNPAMKLVALTRDPVERIWSAYRFAVTNGWEHLPLEDALAAEVRRRHGTRIERVELQYVQNSLYDEHIARLHRYFPASSIHVLAMSELGDASVSALAGLLYALGLDTEDLPPLPAQNTASNAKSASLQRWILGESTLKRLARRTIPPRWKTRIHSHITAPILLWNRVAAQPSVLTNDVRAVITAALVAS